MQQLEAIDLLQEAFEKTAAISLLQIGSKTGTVIEALEKLSLTRSPIDYVYIYIHTFVNTSTEIDQTSNIKHPSLIYIVLLYIIV